MTLDERIEKDLTDLYNNGTINGVISEAVSLQGAIKDKLSTKGMPTHFTGDRNAKTVFVVLNPGSYAEDIIVNGKVVLGSDNPCALKTEINKLKIKTGSLFDFIDSYKDGRSNFGQLTPNKQDSFDIKQADFF